MGSREIQDYRFYRFSRVKRTDKAIVEVIASDSSVSFLLPLFPLLQVLCGLWSIFQRTWTIVYFTFGVHNQPVCASFVLHLPDCQFWLKSKLSSLIIIFEQYFPGPISFAGGSFTAQNVSPQNLGSQVRVSFFSFMYFHTQGEFSVPVI